MHYFFLNDPATPEIYTLSLHDALPISSPYRQMASGLSPAAGIKRPGCGRRAAVGNRSEEHTSELQSHHDLVCRLLLEKKKLTAICSGHQYPAFPCARDR